MHTLAANITSILKRQPLSCDMWATLVIRNGLSSRDDPIGQVGEKAAQVGHVLWMLSARRIPTVPKRRVPQSSVTAGPPERRKEGGKQKKT